jgi:ornithine cyclodeaminase
MIDAAAVTAALPFDACIEVMDRALRAFDRGAAIQPLRSVIQLKHGGGALYTMPAYLDDPRALAVKMISVFPGNEHRGVPTHQGVVAVFDTNTGVPVLLIDAARLTAIRTAAVTAVATRALARESARVLAVLGTGVQARSHIAALPLVRELHEVRVWGRTREHAEALADELDGEALRVTVADSVEEAVSGADIVCTTTSAREPILHARWLAPGVHINAIGSSTPDAREVDSDVVARARVFVDSVDAAAVEAGDLLIPRREGLSDMTAWAPIGAVLNGGAVGRSSDDQITLFKSVGLAIEDAAAAAHIARQILADGTEVA